MIIMDLDGTLANIDHRQHFVDPSKNPNFVYLDKDNKLGWKQGYYSNLPTPYKGFPWKPDWKAFFEACDKDEPNWPVIQTLLSLKSFGYEIQIWSGRCESVRKKTEDWLECVGIYTIPKMRPIGDSTPDDKLKEIWLNERCSDHIEVSLEGRPHGVKHDIEFVFDDSETCCNMWTRRGIMCFQPRTAHGNSDDVRPS